MTTKRSSLPSLGYPGISNRSPHKEASNNRSWLPCLIRWTNFVGLAAALLGFKCGSCLKTRKNCKSLERVLHELLTAFLRRCIRFPWRESFQLCCCPLFMSLPSGDAFEQSILRFVSVLKYDCSFFRSCVIQSFRWKN
jgi:hypothetical protein